MGLDDAYEIANIINDKINDGTLKKEVIENITVSINVPSDILFGIDKEFYRISHNGSTSGFKHTPKVCAKIDNIPFIFECKTITNNMV